MWKQDLKDLMKEPVTTVAVIVIAFLMALSLSVEVSPANAQTSNERHRELQALESIARDLKAVRQKIERCGCQ